MSNEKTICRRSRRRRWNCRHRVRQCQHRHHIIFLVSLVFFWLFRISLFSTSGKVYVVNISSNVKQIILIVSAYSVHTSCKHTHTVFSFFISSIVHTIWPHSYGKRKSHSNEKGKWESFSCVPLHAVFTLCAHFAESSRRVPCTAHGIIDSVLTMGEWVSNGNIARARIVERSVRSTSFKWMMSIKMSSKKKFLIHFEFSFFETFRYFFFLILILLATFGWDVGTINFRCTAFHNVCRVCDSSSFFSLHFSRVVQIVITKSIEILCFVTTQQNVRRDETLMKA